MSSPLKRKRGKAVDTEPLKRTSSLERKPPSAELFDNSRIGWDAAFGKSRGATEVSNVNGTGTGNEAGSEESEGEDFEKFVLHKARNNVTREKRSKRPLKKASQWSCSKPIAGRMLDIDPIFSQDEKFLIVAHRRCLKIYSTANSLLNRSIELPLDPERKMILEIVSYTLSTTDPNKIWVACANGAVFKIDWTTGRRSHVSWTTSASSLSHIACGSLKGLQNARDIFYTAGLVDEKWSISANELVDEEDKLVIRTKVIYISDEPFHIMTVANENNAIIAAAGNNVIVGTPSLRASAAQTVDQIKVEMLVFQTPEAVSSLDARFSIRSSDKDILFGRSKAAKIELNVVDLIVGDVKGSIFVYDDVYGKTHRSQIKWRGASLPQSASSLVPRKLHWHRKSVASAKWSLDGNYIISGGTETTLVLWQLDTGHRQFLPHLSAAILNIVVSPNGTSYGIHLSDNSTMVMSTSELIPTANISGLQAHVLQSSDRIEDTVRRVTDFGPGKFNIPRLQVLIDPTNSSQLLLAVGQSQLIGSRSNPSFSTQYIQTFDIANNHNIAHQALTRTSVTNINVSPQELPLTEPIITHMQISSDGMWLATIDEWSPPTHDMSSLGHNGQSINPEQQRRREIYLKFWRRERLNDAWILVNRIDAPHSANGDNIGTGRVLSLVSDPSSLSFATVGEDGVVLIWKSKVRKRDGVTVYGEKGEPARIWTSTRRVILSRVVRGDEIEVSTTAPRHACLAFSEDGSVIAAAMDGNEDGVVDLIQANTGIIQHSRPLMYTGSPISLSFIAQYLIILSDDLRVYDLVSFDLLYGMELAAVVRKSLAVEQKAAMMHLAVDLQSRTFAVALPYKQEWQSDEKSFVSSFANAYSEIAVFSVDDPAPMYTHSMQEVATAVVPAISSPGYFIIDAAGEITSLAPKTVQTLVSISRPLADLRLDLKNPESAETVNTDNAEQEIDEEEAEEEEELGDPMDIDLGTKDEDEPPHWTTQQLGEIFDIAPTYQAMPSMEDMYDRVADLVAAKPRVKAI